MPATTFSTPVKRSRTLGALASTLVASAAIVAASRVCRNAFLNHELEVFDIEWCSHASADKAMTRYRAIVRHNRLAGGEFAELSTRIVLSAK